MTAIAVASVYGIIAVTTKKLIASGSQINFIVITRHPVIGINYIIIAVSIDIVKTAAGINRINKLAALNQIISVSGVYGMAAGIGINNAVPGDIYNIRTSRSGKDILVFI